MKILRTITYILLVTDLFVFALFHKILQATNWSMDAPVIFFCFVTLVFILLVGLYDLVTFGGRASSLKKLLLPGLLVVLLFFAKLNPLEWPYGHKIALAGNWEGKMTSGRIVFYESGLFELDWNGWARDGNYHGTWSKSNQTISLQYMGKKLDRVGEELVLKNDTLFPVNGYEDTFLKGVEFTIVQTRK